MLTFQDSVRVKLNYKLNTNIVPDIDCAQQTSLTLFFLYPNLPLFCVFVIYYSFSFSSSF